MRRRRRGGCVARSFAVFGRRRRRAHRGDIARGNRAGSRTPPAALFRLCSRQVAADHGPQSQYWRGSSADGRLSRVCALHRESGISYSDPDFRADFSFLRLVGFDPESRPTFDIVKGSYLKWNCRSPTRSDRRFVGLNGH
jgi:hypothetical protein